MSARPLDEEIFQRDSFRCVYCGFDGSTFEKWVFLQVDHFKPRCLGGSDEADNLVTACIVCNHMKGAFTYSSREEARKSISQWRSQMQKYWDEKVKQRISQQED